MLASLKISDLIINDNPCHQEALEVAKKNRSRFYHGNAVLLEIIIKVR